MFTYRTKKTAPAESPPQFDRSQKNYGFISILHQIVAKAPATYYGFFDIFALFEHHTKLTQLE